MPDNLTHRAKVFNSQMSELAPNASNEESSNMTHQAKVLFSQLELLAPDVSSIEPTNENLPEKAKLFNQFMEYFVNNPSPSPGGLPSGYTKVDYIESDGTQRIETGIYNDSLAADRSIRFEGDLYVTSFDKWSSTHQYIGSSGGWDFGNGGNGSGGYVWYVGDVQFSNAPCENQTWYDYSVMINDVSTSRGQYPLGKLASVTKRSDKTTYSLSWAGNGHNLVNQSYQICLFSLDGQAHPCKWRKSYERIYVNNELVREYVACIRDSDNEAGMYDFVTEQFYANAGTGSFITPTAP